MREGPCGEVLRQTKSVCPVCLARVEAAYVRRAGAVWLEKACPAHGAFSARVWDNAESFAAWQRQSPAQPPARPAKKAAKGCPYDCGLCENHRQASCCVLLEVTARCNLGCPVCYAAASARPAAEAAGEPSVETIAGWYDMLLAHGGPFNIQLSGGEPTLRDDLPEIIRKGRERGFRFFQLNTNGLRLAKEPAYLEKLVAAGLNTVFLQFDSLDGAACAALRGQDLVETKKRAIQSCAAAGAGVVLVPTVAAGVNLGHLGELLAFAAENMPTVRGVHFQPISYFGRISGINEENRVTVPALLAALESQTNGRVKANDFAPGGAEHPMCTFHADYEIDNNRWKAVKSAGAACCRNAPTSSLARDAVARKWSAPAFEHFSPPGLPAAAHKQAPLAGGKYDLGALDDFLRRRETRTLALSGMAFQDAFTLDLERLARCHVHVVSPEGSLVPFCAWNLTAADGTPLYRGRARAHA